MARHIGRGLVGGTLVAAALWVASPGCDPSESTGAEAAAATECNRALAVTSREYKLMLDAGAFAGAAPEAAVDAFQQELLQAIASGLGRETTGDLSALDKIRTVRFYDTPGDCLLRSSGWIFRERVEDGEREVTLKYRSPDRYLAAAADLEPADSTDAKTKFEQDIKSGYVSVFSRSTKLPIAADKNLNRLDDPIRLFPGLEEAGLDPNRDMLIVGGLTVNESVYGDLIIDLGKLEAEMSLTLWYVEGASDPAVAEVSFKYESDDESYATGSVERGVALFDILQSLVAWQATDSTTKTAFAYGFDPTFCQP